MQTDRRLLAELDEFESESIHAEINRLHKHHEGSQIQLSILGLIFL